MNRMKAMSERGSTLILVLITLLITTLLGASLLFVSDIELRSSKAYSDSVEAIASANSGLSEMRWRLDQRSSDLVIKVNDLVDYAPAIDSDPHALLSNEVDDDGDGEIDEPDELNLARDWQVRLVLATSDTSYGTPFEIVDTDLTAGPPFGSKFVVPTVQPDANWKHYSTSTPGDADVLTVRFKLDTDTAIGDSEGDGAEIIFFDPDLAMDDVDDLNTLSGLGGDGDPSNDSPYNIDWTDGTTDHPAAGNPVLIITSTGQIYRAGKRAMRRQIEVTLSRVNYEVVTRALCGFSELDGSGGGITNSYSSADGAYGTGPIGSDAGVASNGDLTLAGGYVVNGNVESGGSTTFNGAGATVTGDLTTGGAISGSNRTVGGTELAYVDPPPMPCGCRWLDVDDLALAAKTDNDNSNIVGDQGPVLRLNANQTIILPGGDYYFSSISVTAMASIQVGIDTDGDGTVDAPPNTPARIFVDGDINIGGQAVINAGTPYDLQIYSSGTSPDAVTINGSTDFQGFVYAPETDITLNGSADFSGAAYGNAVKHTGTAPVHFDIELAELLGFTGPNEKLSWREVQ